MWLKFNNFTRLQTYFYDQEEYKRFSKETKSQQLGLNKYEKTTARIEKGTMRLWNHTKVTTEEMSEAGEDKVGLQTNKVRVMEGNNNFMWKQPYKAGIVSGSQRTETMFDLTLVCNISLKNEIIDHLISLVTNDMCTSLCVTESCPEVWFYTVCLLFFSKEG